jgi:hypothetical protein
MIRDTIQLLKNACNVTIILVGPQSRWSRVEPLNVIDMNLKRIQIVCTSKHVRQSILPYHLIGSAMLNIQQAYALARWKLKRYCDIWESCIILKLLYKLSRNSVHALIRFKSDSSWSNRQTYPTVSNCMSTPNRNP